MLGTIIVPFTEKVFGDHNYEVLTSSRNGIQRQSEHFAGKQRHDTDGYNIIPRGYCTYRNRSDDGLFTFNMNNIVDEGIVSKFYPVFTFQNANSTFMMEYLNGSPRVRAKLSVLAVGTSQVVLSFETLKETSFYLPTFEEQNRIAALLSTLNKRIEKQRLLIEHLKKYKRGAIQSIFERKIRLSSADPWECEKLGNIFFERNERSWGNEELLAVTIQNGVQKRSEIDLKDNSSEDKSNYKRVLIGDIAYNTMRMWQGASGGSLYDGIVSPAYTVISPNDPTRHNFRFWAYYFKHTPIVQTFQKYSQGLTSDTWNLKFPQLSEINVDYPSREEQDLIVTFLERLDEKYHAEEMLLSALIKIKKQLLSDLFI